MIFRRPSYGNQRKRFAWLPTPRHNFRDGYSVSGWIWFEEYVQTYCGHYWGWKNSDR